MIDSYRVDYENTDPLYTFNVDPLNGVVSLRSKLARETPRLISLRILAIDKGRAYILLIIVLIACSTNNERWRLPFIGQ